MTRNGVSRGGACSGARTSRGWGSKVITPSGAPSVAGPRPRGLDQGAMAAMHAIEIADRDHAVEGGLRQIPIAPVDPHRRLMPAPRRRCKEISPAPVSGHQAVAARERPILAERVVEPMRCTARAAPAL